MSFTSSAMVKPTLPLGDGQNPRPDCSHYPVTVSSYGSSQSVALRCIAGIPAHLAHFPENQPWPHHSSELCRLPFVRPQWSDLRCGLLGFSTKASTEHRTLGSQIVNMAQVRGCRHRPVLPLPYRPREPCQRRVRRSICKHPTTFFVACQPKFATRFKTA